MSTGQNVHKQKGLVLCNLSEPYSAFRDKYLNIKIRFSKFCTLRPKWCVLAGSSGSHSVTHSVCICSTHQKAVLLVDVIDWEYTYKDLIKKVVCDRDNKVCMMHRCESCPGSTALKKFLDDELRHLDMDSEFHYCQWQTTDRAALATLTTTFKESKKILIDSINNLTRHSYLAKAQARYMKLKRESLGQTRLWCLGTSQRTSSVRSRTRYKVPTDCTLHPLVIYYKDADGNLQHYETLFHFR